MTFNGKKLTEGQLHTLRMALGYLHIELSQANADGELAKSKIEEHLRNIRQLDELFEELPH